MKIALLRETLRKDSYGGKDEPSLSSGKYYSSQGRAEVKAFVSQVWKARKNTVGNKIQKTVGFKLSSMDYNINILGIHWIHCWVLSSEEYDLIYVFKKSLWLFFGKKWEKGGQFAATLLNLVKDKWNCGFYYESEDGETCYNLGNSFRWR